MYRHVMGRQGTPINYRWGELKNLAVPLLKSSGQRPKMGLRGRPFMIWGGGPKEIEKKISETFLKEKKEDGH